MASGVELKKPPMRWRGFAAPQIDRMTVVEVRGSGSAEPLVELRTGVGCGERVIILSRNIWITQNSAVAAAKRPRPSLRRSNGYNGRERRDAHSSANNQRSRGPSGQGRQDWRVRRRELHAASINAQTPNSTSTAPAAPTRTAMARTRDAPLSMGMWGAISR